MAISARVEALRACLTALPVMRTSTEARYDRFDHVLAEVKRAGITRLGFAGNDAMVDLAVVTSFLVSLDMA